MYKEKDEHTTAYAKEKFAIVGRQEKQSEEISRPRMNTWKEGWLRLKQNKGTVISIGILFILLVLAIVGPHINAYDYQQTNYDKVYTAPDGENWLGTDKFGRDQWTRLWEGTRISLYIAVLAALLDIAIGITYGAISGMKGGRTDNIMQRIIEILVGVPNLVIVILLIMIMRPGILTITIALVITGWVNMARLVRGQVFKLKNQEYVLAAKALGASTKRMIAKHMIPNTMGIIVVNMMFTIPNAIFMEAFLSFIGLGLQEPMASLGVLINDGYQSMRSHFYLLLFPSIVIISLMVCFNLLADGLRDALDPRMRK